MFKWVLNTQNKKKYFYVRIFGINFLNAKKVEQTMSKKHTNT